MKESRDCATLKQSSPAASATIKIFSEIAPQAPNRATHAGRQTSAAQVAKDSDSGDCRFQGLLKLREPERVPRDETMTDKTCAACDCKLDENSIKVTLRGKTVEVCCEECARKLNEADASARREN